MLLILKMPFPHTINIGILQLQKSSQTELKNLLFLLLISFKNPSSQIVFCFVQVRWKCWSSCAHFITSCRCIMGDRRRYTSSILEKDESVLKTLCLTQASVYSAQINFLNTVKAYCLYVHKLFCIYFVHHIILLL